MENRTKSEALRNAIETIKNTRLLIEQIWPGARLVCRPDPLTGDPAFLIHIPGCVTSHKFSTFSRLKKFVEKRERRKA